MSRRVKILLGLTLMSFGAAWTTSSMARGVNCTRTQSQCVTRSNDVTIGDKVGFFDTRDRLVATGTVRKMKGSLRLVRIEESNTPIPRTARLALLETSGGREPDYAMERVIQRQRLYEVEGSYGSAAMKIGSGFGASLITMGGSRLVLENVIDGLRVGVHAVSLQGSGLLAHSVDPMTRAVVDNTITLRAFGLVPTLSYTFLPEQMVSFRAEAGYGLMDVNASIDGNQDAVPIYDVPVGVQSGWSGMSAFRGNLMVNLDRWHPELGMNYVLLNQAVGVGIHAGLTIEIK